MCSNVESLRLSSHDLLYQSDSSQVDTLRTAAGILSEHKSVLEHLGKSRKFLETLLRFGTPLSEVSFHESEIMVSETSTMKAGTHDKGGTWLCECTLQGKANKCRRNLDSKHLK
jgi:hypothetical protein